MLIIAVVAGECPLLGCCTRAMPKIHVDVLYILPLETLQKAKLND